VDTHPEAIAAALKRWRNEPEKVGLETGSMSPWLARGFSVLGFPVVCMNARRLVQRGACEERRESHRLKALLGARDQLVRAKRALGNQVRGLLRPFGIRLPSRQGTKKLAEAAHQAVAHDAMLAASVTALMDALAAIEGRLVRLDDRLKELARSSPVCWRLMSVPGVGPIVALAFMATLARASFAGPI
jgi:transposase